MCRRLHRNLLQPVYPLGGKEKRVSFGVYPDVSLKTARAKRGDARQKLAHGILDTR